MNLLDTIFNGFSDYQHLISEITTTSECKSLGLMRSARPPVVSQLWRDLGNPLLYITDRPERAMNFLDELNFWNDQIQPLYFSEPAALFYEDSEWSDQVRQERLGVFSFLIKDVIPGIKNQKRTPLIVSTVRALMFKTIPKRVFIKNSLHVELTQKMNLEHLQNRLSLIGYDFEEVVTQAGKFSKRGGLIDIWIPSEPLPVRVDFFGDVVDTIRSFDPATQRTMEKLDRIFITPASELISVGENVTQRKNREFILPEAYSYPVSITDYLPKSTSIIFDDRTLLSSLADEFEEQAVQLRQDLFKEGVKQNELKTPYFNWSELLDIFSPYKSIDLSPSLNADFFPFGKCFQPTKRYAGMLKNLIEDIYSACARGDNVMVTSRHVSRIEELWRECKYDLNLRNAPIFLDSIVSEGWELRKNQKDRVRLLTDSEIFGWSPPAARRKSSATAIPPEDTFGDLRIGDWVVHVDFGIGKFLGLVRRILEGNEKEFLCIEFENSDQIFVPVHQADRLTRFIGPNENPPALTKLGTAEWQSSKQKVKEAVHQVARELLELYAKRETARGFAFSSDGAWQKELEAGFPYIETQDQKQAIIETKMDMEKQKPMDRLLCGDVGYGKTEVALRAAFKAVQDGKQVVILVPTTVLAQQHYETFLQRLLPWPVTVDMLSRFRSPKEQDEIARKLGKGEIDIIIGTHRLLTADVQFKDLGLAIIDEEQRFGVTHKEHFKKLRTEIDVLTLTATPIPRTLYMALTGVRDISVINTPPAERQPIITHIGPYSPRLVRQAIIRELERGGQVFFVHNRVMTIDAIKINLQKLVPEARIGIAHGQMDEKELAAVMHHFTQAELDVLLCTSIIESGLDIPNANTLIVDRGDTFGLAQLYQLRGRVGRGGQRAYAYFFRDSRHLPTPEGQERLEVIAENTQLGAGYSIAMRDLEMRGAGDILGTRQSGYIAAVGFHLYTRMLAGAVRELKQKGGVELKPLPLDQLNELYSVVIVELPLSVGIPIGYVSQQNMRLKLYRRIANIQTEREAEAIKEEFIDRFGPLPEELENLIYYIIIKNRACLAGLASVMVENEQIVLRYPTLGDNQRSRNLYPIKKARIGKNSYWIPFQKESKEWKNQLLDILVSLINFRDRF